MGSIACCGTDIGIRRLVNQDAVSIKTSYINGADCYMAIACDGVGGLARGEYASSCMRERLECWFLYEYPQIAGNEEAGRIIPERLRKAVELQNKILYEYGSSHGIRCGTTVSALLLTRYEYFIVHVGDSRVYRLDKKVEQLTEDQTLIARDIRRGLLTKEAAQRDARKHMIEQGVGVNKSVDILLYRGNVSGDFCFLVCTDGFYHCVTESELLELFCGRTYKNSEEMGIEIERLIMKLKKRGERDNISAAVIQRRG